MEYNRSMYYFLSLIVALNIVILFEVVGYIVRKQAAAGYEVSFIKTIFFYAFIVLLAWGAVYGVSYYIFNLG